MNVENIGKITLNLLNEYTKKISSCKDISDYINLITAIHIFHSVVFIQLKKEFEAENIPKEEADNIIKSIQQTADQLLSSFNISAETKTHSFNKEKININ